MKQRLARHHFVAEMRQNIREPSTVVPVLLYPPLFYLFFGLPTVTGEYSANLALASYAIYAFMGSAFTQFTGGVVRGRSASWNMYLRTLPASYSHRLVGWTLAGLVVGLLSFAAVAITAVLTTDVDAGPFQWLFLSFAVLFGSVPMGFAASAFGYWLMPRAAVPLATLVYFSLTYMGGIWTSPDSLPGWLQEVSPYLPTRMWAELAWASIESRAWPLFDLVGLTLYTLIAGFLAVWGYRRDTRRRLT